MPKPSYETGVYCWKNRVNGKVYVGGADKSFEKRRARHLMFLKASNHDNRHLQAAWNKYGEKSFDWQVLERCVLAQVEERETHWIKKLHASDRNYGYNICSCGISRTGILHREGSRKKMSVAHKGVEFTPEHKANMKKNHWSKGENAAEIAERCATKHRGRKRHGQALRNIQMGQKIKWEKYQKGVSETGQHIRFTDERRANMSAAVKRWWQERKASR